jgi:hypothetical protein
MAPKARTTQASAVGKVTAGAKAIVAEMLNSHLAENAELIERTAMNWPPSLCSR